MSESLQDRVISWDKRTEDYINDLIAFPSIGFINSTKERVRTLVTSLDRVGLSDMEVQKLLWLATQEQETVEVLAGIFEKLAEKH